MREEIKKVKEKIVKEYLKEINEEVIDETKIIIKKLKIKGDNNE